MSNSLCAYPWRAAAIRPNGLTIPCCRYPHIHDKDMFIQNGDPRTSQHWNSLRQAMLNGEYIENCNGCYSKENNGIRSMRQNSLNKFVPTSDSVKPIEELEIAFSNLCNLACVHCYKDLSTRWYAEDLKAGRVEKTTTTILKNSFDINHWDLSQLKELKLIGGEPLLEQERFIALLESVPLDNISVLICTNGTVLPNKRLTYLLEKCKFITISLSLDGLYTTNDWYRWPSKFNDIMSTINTYESMWVHRANVKLMIHHVVNIINVIELPKFVAFLLNQLHNWTIEWDWIRWPHWQAIAVLPPHVKNELASRFAHLHNALPSHFLNCSPYPATINYLKDAPLTTWSFAKEQIIAISQERRLNHIEMLSSLNPLLSRH